MENVSAIKKYSLTNENIVIKYKKGKNERQNLNKFNLKNLIDKLKKQYPYSTSEIISKEDNLYSLIAYISLIITLIEGIVFLNLLISFEVGQMKKFVVCSILSCTCICIHFIFLFINFILLNILKKKCNNALGVEALVKYVSLYGELTDEEEVEVKEKKKVNKPKKTKKPKKPKKSKKATKKKEEKEEIKEEKPKKEVKVKEVKVKTKEDEEKELVKKQNRKKKAKARKRKAKKAGTGTKKKTKK